jgi:hypothetical protein
VSTVLVSVQEAPSSVGKIIISGSVAENFVINDISINLVNAETPTPITFAVGAVIEADFISGGSAASMVFNQIVFVGTTTASTTNFGINASIQRQFPSGLILPAQSFIVLNTTQLLNVIVYTITIDITGFTVTNGFIP